MTAKIVRQVFVSGYNKSGTTMLQQALDAHKKIACPPEHHLATMLNGFKKTCEDYMNLIMSFDKNTGQQGINLKMDRLYWKMVKEFTEGLFEDAASDNTSVSCIHDNSMVHHHQAFSKLFPDAKWIWIVRDPRAVALSVFKHKVRLEGDQLSPDFNLSQVCADAGPSWAESINTISRVAAASPDQHHILRYEDLSGKDAKRTLANVFKFLEVSSPQASDIVKALRIKKSKGKGGYLSGNSNETWKEEFSEADQKQFLVCTAHMEKFGYLT